MGVSVIALILFIVITIVWIAVLRRDIGEAMFISLIVTALFGGAEAPKLILNGIIFAATNEILFVAIAFVFMAYIIGKTDIIENLIVILTSILGRLYGAAGHVAVIGSSLFGMISGSGSGNQAAIGSFTIPWMIKSGFKKETAATISTGNSGLGTAFPPSASMFLLLGLAPIAAFVSQDQLYPAMLVGGLYQMAYRLFLILFFGRLDKVPVQDTLNIIPISESFRKGWKSLLIFAGILIPIVVTIGPLSEVLKANPNIGPDAMKAISLIVWVPILIIFISFAIGYKQLPKSIKEWDKLIIKSAPQFAELGIVILFAFAVSEVLGQLGLGEDLTNLIQQFNLSRLALIIVICLFLAILAGPLSSTATITTGGIFAFSALTSVGVHPVAACVTILQCASTEGSSPPSSAQIYVAAGMAGSDPVKSFKDLIIYYVAFPVVIAVLIATGILPIPL